jgi:drug/metabolite transporter (DMT)-like permease
MRWTLGILSLIVAMLFWVGSFLAVPYTSWGVADEQVRPGVAGLSSGFALVSIVLILASAFIVLRDPANRGGWRPIPFALALLFLGVTAIARLVWIRFYVLT